MARGKFKNGNLKGFKMSKGEMMAFMDMLGIYISVWGTPTLTALMTDPSEYAKGYEAGAKAFALRLIDLLEGFGFEYEQENDNKKA